MREFYANARNNMDTENPWVFVKNTWEFSTHIISEVLDIRCGDFEEDNQDIPLTIEEIGRDLCDHDPT